MFNVDLKFEAREALGAPAAFNSIFALWPLEKNNFLLRARWYFTILNLIIPVLVTIYESHLTCNHSKNGVDNLVVIAFSLIALSKSIFYYKHRDKLRLNVESAIEDWSSEDAKNYSKIMHQNRSIHNKIALICLGTGMIASTAFFTKTMIFDSNPLIEIISNENGQNGSSIIITGKRFLYPAVCTFNNVSNYTHWAIVVSQFIQFIICVGVNLTCDGFFVAIAHHLGGQYIILKKKFINFKNLENEKETRKEFALLIGRHIELLKLSRRIENSFSMMMLTQMIINVVVISVAGFNLLLSLKRGQLSGALTSILIIHFVLVETYMYSHIGDDLSNHELDIGLSVYESTWHTLPKSLTKDIIFVQTRASSAIHLTAGKFFNMTRSTFTDIVKTAVSYLSVLRVLISDKNL